MSAKFALRSTLIFCIIMLVSTLIVGSSVSAQEITQDDPILASAPEQSIQGGSPIPGGPGFISISAFAFKPNNPSMDLTYTTNSARMFNFGDTYGQYEAAVNLPDLASITKVVFFCYDDVTDYMTFYLFKSNMFDGSITPVVSANSLEVSTWGQVQSLVSPPATVNNQSNSYYLEVQIPNGNSDHLMLANVRIDYDYPVFLPTVQK